MAGLALIGGKVGRYTWENATALERVKNITTKGFATYPLPQIDIPVRGDLSHAAREMWPPEFIPLHSASGMCYNLSCCKTAYAVWHRLLICTKTVALEVGWCRRKVSARMTVTCGACGCEMEVLGDLRELKDGAKLQCSNCGETTEYRKPSRIELPSFEERAKTKKLPPKPRLGVRRQSLDACEHNPVLEDKLRYTINPKQTPHKSVPSGAISAAEERVKMYEDFKRKSARHKMLRNLVETVMLLMLLTTIVGLCLWWQSNRNRVAAEAAKIEAERLRLESERDRIEREKREKDRLEREAERKRQQEEREKQLQAMREAREQADRETRENRERYAMFMLALRENNFNIFTKAVTNEIDKTGGELCYLLPSQETSVPLYHVIYDTNGTHRVLRLEETGVVSEMSGELFDQMAGGSDHLVAKGDTVYFKSRRKSPATGVLHISKPGDPAETFFGMLFPTLKQIKPTYDELTFDILFTPPKAQKPILVENLPFGCAWSPENVREAVENATPPDRGFSPSTSSSKQSKFKRTVKLWEGTSIKRGLDGVTYVPSAPPVERHHVRYYNHLPNTIYSSRHYSYRTGDYERWSALHNQALQEDAAEAEFNERRKEEEAHKTRAKLSAAEEKWQKKIDGIMSKGVLSYRIRKAK